MEENKKQDNKRKLSREEKKNQKRLKKEQKENSDLEKTQKELEDMINNLSKLIDDDSANVKVVRIEEPNLKSKKQVFLLLIDIILTFGLFFGLSGYIKWLEFESIWYFILLIIIYIVLEYVLKRLTFVTFPKAIAYSFGSLLIVPGIISLVITLLIAPSITVLSIGKLIIFYILFIIIKFVIKTLTDKNVKRNIVIKKK